MTERELLLSTIEDLLALKERLERYATAYFDIQHIDLHLRQGPIPEQLDKAFCKAASVAFDKSAQMVNELLESVHSDLQEIPGKKELV